MTDRLYKLVNQQQYQFRASILFSDLKRTDVDIAAIVPAAQVLDIASDFVAFKSNDKSRIVLKRSVSVLFWKSDPCLVQRSHHILAIEFDDSLRQRVVN